jgi:hypothetical protein
MQPDDLREALRFPAAHLADLPRAEIEFNPPSEGEIIQRLAAFRAQRPAEAS